MDGIDLLLQGRQTPQANGLDVLLGGVQPTPAAPTPTLGKAARAIQGVNDVQNAGAQWLYNLMPPAVQKAGDAADHWLYEKTGGAIGTKPGLTFNNAVADQNANYEAARGPNAGIDWMRGIGAGSAQIGLAALTGGASLGPVGGGVMAGALTPVTDIAPGSDNTFAGGAAKNVALGGAVGGAVGTAGNVLASVVKPQVTAAARQLLDAGVPLTPGQMVGGMVKSVEDKLTSVPVVGDLIKGAQERAVAGLNRAAYSRVLDPLKQAGFDAPMPAAIGRAGIDAVTQSVQDAYNSLVPKLSLRMDEPLLTELANVRGMASTGLAPPQAARFEQILQNHVYQNLTPEGNSSGRALQGMLSDLGKQAAGYVSDSSFENQQLGAALKTVEQSLRDGLTRNNPLYAGKLASVNEAFANLARVQSAGAMQGAGNGVFSGAQLSAAVKAGDKTVRDNAFARGKALMQDLSDPAKDLLGSSVPNSGTTDRAMTAGALGALLAHPVSLLNPAVLGGALPSALIYTEKMSPLVQKAVTARPAGAAAAANLLRSGTQRMTPGVTGGLLSQQPDVSFLTPWAAPQ